LTFRILRFIEIGARTVVQVGEGEKSMRQATTRILGSSVAMLVLIASAYASSINFMPGDHPQPDEQNILFNTDMVGHTIIGHTNQSHTPVDFISVSTLLSGMGGQAHIDAENGGLIFDITLTVPGHAFQ
jgi:hypothetical protein